MKKLTKKQRNQIYWKAYEFQAEDHGGICYAIVDAAAILFDKKSLSWDDVPEWELIWNRGFIETDEMGIISWHLSWPESPNQQAERETAICLCIAMTEDGK